ncbi:hypothetical protein L1987_03839 [Smallanthus sonchifolius]|uniref:Uncharacterized protein n=1 Tax=Smallanthus sonchifolius TaxID=185202 RepID=A0ACB9KBM9_9ASTR|nr:hypothetical protein L1987_03839 [Smallanthus sonchifolius]
MAYSSSNANKGKGKASNSPPKGNPWVMPAKKKPEVLCMYCYAPTFYYYDTVMCSKCDARQPKDWEITGRKLAPTDELLFKQMNPEMFEDPDVMKSIYAEEDQKAKPTVQPVDDPNNPDWNFEKELEKMERRKIRRYNRIFREGGMESDASDDVDDSN